MLTVFISYSILFKAMGRLWSWRNCKVQVHKAPLLAALFFMLLMEASNQTADFFNRFVWSFGNGQYSARQKSACVGMTGQTLGLYVLPYKGLLILSHLLPSAHHQVLQTTWVSALFKCLQFPDWSRQCVVWRIPRGFRRGFPVNTHCEAGSERGEVYTV